MAITKARYHINKKGQVGVCKASLKCPFGDMEKDHYDTQAAARAAYEAASQAFTPAAPRAAWTDKVFYALDIESTSANPLEAHVVTCTVIKFDGGQVVDKRSWAINPGVPMPAEASEINGLTDEWIQANGGEPQENLEDILATTSAILNSGKPLVVYNAAYDLTMLEKQAELHGLSSLRKRVKSWKTVIDPFVLAKGFEKFRTQEGAWGKGYKLPEVCERYGVAFDESHDATADAVGAGQLAMAVVNAHPALREAGPRQLTAFQKDWRTRMQDDLRAYFDRKKKEHDGVDAGWPLHTAVAAPEED